MGYIEQTDIGNVYVTDINDWLASLSNLNRECKTYTDSEIRYKEILSEYDKQIRSEVIEEFCKEYKKFQDDENICDIQEDCSFSGGWCIDCFKDKWLKEQNKMSEIVRELTSRELVEESDCKNKEIILSRMKAEDNRTMQRIDALEEERNYLVNLTDAYRMVIKDIVRRVMG